MEGRVIYLGIDTATPRTSLALGSDEGVVASLTVEGRAREDVVVPALERLLAWAGRDPGDLAGIAAGIGPGLFTGLRVGVETAKTLAQVLDRPLVAVPSLDVLAHGVRHAAVRIVAVIDARRGEVFHAAYRSVDDGVRREREMVVASPEALAEELRTAGEPVLLVGDGALRYRDRLATAGSVVTFAGAASATPRADDLVAIASPRFRDGRTDAWADVVPLYLRRTDAEIAWDRRDATA